MCCLLRPLQQLAALQLLPLLLCLQQLQLLCLYLVLLLVELRVLLLRQQQLQPREAKACW
jgi:hypothetical protein